MHQHPIDFSLPFNMGRVKALIEHKPLDTEHILLVVHIEHVPPAIKLFIPKGYKNGPIQKPVRRSLIRTWCGQGLEWANEPAEGAPHAE
ncbi:hypothetical protein [Kordiimonas sp.]|uniref:hypothetical protein n=1 Tax=Kordiimonas sp. TaxID=1970157 RepID=UPI003A945096